jgi:signal transduction histidine kinase/DNA-binding LytR/AlgR family response regulator
MPTAQECRRPTLLPALITILVVALAYAAIIVHRDLERERLALRTALADYAAQSLSLSDKFFTRQESVLAAVAASSCLTMRLADACDEYFSRLLGRFPDAENFAASDREGVIFASSLRVPLPPPNVRELPFFEKLVGGRSAMIMDPHLGPVSGKQVVGIAIPLRDADGGFDGVIGVTVGFAQIEQLLHDGRDGERTLAVVDGQQRLILAAGPLAGERDRPATLIASVLEREGDNRVSLGGQDFLTHTRFLRAGEWKIVALSAAGFGLREYLATKLLLPTLLLPLLLLGTLGLLIHRRERRAVALLAASEERLRVARDVLESEVAERTAELSNSTRQLRDQQLRLEELVQQRTAELTQALEAARLADQAKDQFLANVSHELRTPLNAVIGLSGLARRLSTDPRQQDYLDKVSSAGKSLAQLINDLLDLSKIVAGRLEFANTPFSLRGMAARSRSVIMHKAREKGLALVERIDEEVPDLLLGDPLRIEQILLNLLSNAIKFTAAGRIDLHIALVERQATRLCLAIEVSDTGVGLDDATVAQIFRPFIQADASVTRQYGGSGLGLAICKQLAELMAGGISVSSRPGVGSTFRVTLWLAPGDPTPVSREGERPALPVGYQNAQVLVVEDQPLNREIVEALLNAVGITPAVAGNGREALDLLQEVGARAFDLVLMDIQMPVMDGLSASRELRTLAGFETLPIIAMTAHTMAHEKEVSVAAGMSDFIGKPFDNQAFYGTLAKWIPRRKHRLAAAIAAPPDALPAPPGNGEPWPQAAAIASLMAPTAGPPPAPIAAVIALLESSDGGSARAIEGCLDEFGKTAWAPLLQAALVRVHGFDFEAARRFFPANESARKCSSAPRTT